MTLNRLIVAAIALFGLTLAAEGADPAARPNVLLICVDDMRPELNCYGAKHVISPNIDRLSASGVTFDQCHVQVAVCNPSRASLMTGLRPDKLRCWTLRYHFRETMPDAVTLPQYLRGSGYVCEAMGKIFHNPWQDPRSWSVPHRWGEGSFNHYTAAQRAFTAEVDEKLPEGSWQKGTLRGPITNAPDIKDEEHVDGSMTLMAVDRLKSLKAGDKPFFLAVGYVLPHLAWCPPKKYWDLYDRQKLPLAENPEPPTNAPAIALGTNYEFSHYADAIDTPKPLEGKVSEEDARRYRHGYLASISFVDAQIGHLLDALDAQGLTDNTIVVLWSDHGYKLGEHNGWGKMTNFEIDTRVPLIIRDPRAKANGQRCQRLVETLDLFPTICELAGVAAPDFVDGKSAAPLLNDPSAKHIDAAFSQYIWPPMIGNAIRTDEWRYVEWRNLADGAVQHRELYDHRTEHGENHNVAGEHAEIEAALAERLAKTLPPQPIDQLPKIRSARDGAKVTVKCVNKHDGPVRMTWINPLGVRAQVFDIPAGKTRPINTTTGHVFVAESLDGRYHRIITIARDEATIEVGTAGE